MMSFSEDKLQAVTEQIVQKFRPERIILLGSQATGQAIEESDVDLLVVKETNKSTRQMALEIDGAIFPRPFMIDLIVYTPKQLKKAQEAGDYFILDILSKGRVLCAR